MELDGRLVLIGLNKENVAVPDVVAFEVVDDEVAVVACRVGTTKRGRRRREEEQGMSDGRAVWV
jgi:hypothetical protein